MKAWKLAIVGGIIGAAFPSITWMVFEAIGRGWSLGRVSACTFGIGFGTALVSWVILSDEGKE